MIIELVSQHAGKTADVRLKHVIQIINNSMADLIVFAGHALIRKKDVSSLRRALKNNTSAVLLETKEGGNHLYRIESGKIIDLNTHQVFKTSDEINKEPRKADALLNELESNRCFEVKGRKCLVLQCGELNILRNYQSDGNRVAFRFDNTPELEKRFFKLIEQSDIILNPIHKPMGNQGKLSKRRITLSDDGRAYFSTCNALTGDSLSLKQKSLQYATVNGKDYPESESVQFGRSYIIRTYEL